MWLRNYYNILTAAMLSDDTLTSTSQPSSYTPPIMGHKTNGSWSQIKYNVAGGAGSTTGIPAVMLPGKMGLEKMSSETSSFSNSNSRLGLCIGDGSGSESYEDYHLINVISPSNWTLVSSEGTLKSQTDIDGSDISSARTYTVNNSSASSLTISEIGLYLYDGTNLYMVYHAVLDEAVTLAPGESMILEFNRAAQIYNYTPYPA